MSAPTVTVLSRPGCQPCRATYRDLTRRGLPYEAVDVDQTPEAVEMAMALGHSALPVVIVNGSTGVEESWSGYAPSRIEALEGRLSSWRDELE